MPIYLKCPHCHLCIDLAILKSSELCIMCGGILKESGKLSNIITPN